MTPGDPSPRLLYLLSRLSDGLLDPAEAEELDRILCSDAAARAYYRCHAAVHVALGSEEAGPAKALPFPATRRARRWPALAAAAALALAAGTTWWSLWDGRQDLPGETADQAPAGTAVLAVTSAADRVRWNLPVTPEGGMALGAGKIRIYSGDLSLSLVGGQTVHVRGPAEFELLGDGEFALLSGPAAFRTVASKTPFIVHLPKGALVDMGSDFSVEVGTDRNAEVRVFERELTASTIGATGRTLEELQLPAGSSILLGTRLSPSSRPATDFLRVPPTPLSAPPGSEESYAAGVLASSPAAYWRFESLDPERRVPDETGDHPLQLHDLARLGGEAPQRYLLVNKSDAAGFGLVRDGIAGLDTARGVTVECLVFSSAENHGTAVAFELADLPPRLPDLPRGIRHAPQTFTIERMGRKGEHIGHIHPDFALRAMFRSPAGYVGGTNLYSRESHLLHRWIHVAAVHDGARILLYVDGQLSDSTTTSLTFNDARLRPIIGRLKPLPGEDLRQWIGGIDEVALYGRALPAAEIRAHFSALKP